MPKIVIPSALKGFTGGHGEVNVEGATVGAALDAFVERFPDMRKHLYDDSGRLRHFVNIYVNDADMRELQKTETPLNETDEVSIVPAIAGGVDTAADPLSGQPWLNNRLSSLPELNQEEKLRYSRHLIMPEVGVEGQRKLKAASVICIGTGGLGAPLALYLSAAGIGRIGLVDYDVVDFTNLHRQVIHFTGDVGKPKLQSAAEKIEQINPNVTLDLHETVLTSENAMDILRPYDIVIDGTDNFPTRYLVNDACVLLGKPNVYGSIFRFEGMASVFDARRGPCYRCMFPEPPPPGMVPSCAEGGVLGILPGLIGVVQATEAIKLILGIGDPLIGRLLWIDALKMRIRELKLAKDPDCPVCGVNPTIHELIDYQQFCGIPTHQEEGLGSEWEITPREVKARLDRGDRLQIIDVRNPEEWEISRIEGARLVPLPQLADRLGEIPRDVDLVLQCKSGVRSARALEQLRDAGYTRLKNLQGGILAWSDEVDPSVAKY
ncbi:MAG TPA: molybdopterin-synthase adenylyltransferase MoeB [Armatimonadota bacterium]|nr:molybdopterin-synthase adenylyltransferase MoeB [Armatimonadota bacterium]